MTIRQENNNDYEAVFNLIEEAFRKEEFSDHKEQFLVERLRNSNTFIPELSLVAESDGKIIGHILLTKVHIKNEQTQFDSLALAPVSVLPAFQGKGIGSALIKKAHKIAIDLGHKSIVLLGHEDYYPRFGYQQANSFGITFPFDAPKENCMVIELVKNGLKRVQGVVAYPKEFSC